MKKLVLALLAVSCAIPAFAGDTYVGASIGSTKQKLTIDGIGGSDNSTGFNVFSGYQFTPMFGAEVGYAHFGEASGSDGAFGVNAKPSAVYVAATGTWPLTNEVAAFAKLGMARAHTKMGATDGVTTVSATENRTSAMFGLGVSYAVSANVSIIAEYQNFGKVAKFEEIFNNASLKLDQLSIGARYKF